MKTLTVRLPESIVAEIDAESRRRKLPRSDIVRERLLAGLKMGQPLPSIADLIGSVDGLPEDLSARRKHYLKKTGYGRKKAMKLSESVKPLSYLKSHAAEALRTVRERQRTMVITQHGEAKAVLQDIVSYERLQESLALLKILAQTSKSVAKGRVKPVKAAFTSVRKRIKTSGS
jgi:prevent-host-death family protein